MQVVSKRLLCAIEISYPKSYDDSNLSQNKETVPWLSIPNSWYDYGMTYIYYILELGF